MHVTIQLREDAARGLRERRAATAPTRELLRAAEDLGVELRPLDAGADSPALSRYFTVEVPNREAAERVVARLRRCGAVEAAYLKPPDEMP